MFQFSGKKKIMFVTFSFSSQNEDLMKCILDDDVGGVQSYLHGKVVLTLGTNLLLQSIFILSARSLYRDRMNLSGSNRTWRKRKERERERDLAD